jgi:hypothetical protein
MLKAKKIRLDLSEQDAATLEFMQGKCRGLYNWLVMRLRAGERWHFAEEKARLAACRAYDPELNDVYGKLQDASLFPAGQCDEGLLPPGQGRGDAGVPAGAAPPSVLHPLLVPRLTCALRGDS